MLSQLSVSAGPAPPAYLPEVNARWVPATQPFPSWPLRMQILSPLGCSEPREGLRSNQVFMTVPCWVVDCLENMSRQMFRDSSACNSDPVMGYITTCNNNNKTNLTGTQRSTCRHPNPRIQRFLCLGSIPSQGTFLQESPSLESLKFMYLFKWIKQNQVALSPLPWSVWFYQSRAGNPGKLVKCTKKRQILQYQRRGFWEKCIWGIISLVYAECKFSWSPLGALGWDLTPPSAAASLVSWWKGVGWWEPVTPPPPPWPPPWWWVTRSRTVVENLERGCDDKSLRPMTAGYRKLQEATTPLLGGSAAPRCSVHVTDRPVHGHTGAQTTHLFFPPQLLWTDYGEHLTGCSLVWPLCAHDHRSLWRPVRPVEQKVGTELPATENTPHTRCLCGTTTWWSRHPAHKPILPSGWQYRYQGSDLQATAPQHETWAHVRISHCAAASAWILGSCGSC